MATDRETIKTWFETGDTPTEAQFAEALDSYVHQDDLSDVAKESSEKNIENKVLDNNSKLVAIATELDKIGSPAEGQPTTLFAAIAAGGSGGGGGRASVNGYLVNNGADIRSVADVIVNRSYVVEVNDSDITTLNIANAFIWAVSMRKITLPNVTDWTATSVFNNLSGLEEVYLPELKEISAVATRLFYSCLALRTFYAPKLEYLLGDRTFSLCKAITEVDLPKLKTFAASLAFSDCTNLQVIKMPKVVTISTTTAFSNDVNLIDWQFGECIIGSVNASAWSPTNALLSTSNSLVNEGETFANNLEKLLYNIREHIAAKLPNGSFTITFSSAVKAAINADATTLAAFTSKGWTIA